MLPLASLLLAPTMLDVTDAVGLGPDVIAETVPRVCIADLNNDDWPDLVVNRHRVFLNVADAASPIGRRFKEKRSGLLAPLAGTGTVFADLDNDGNLDAIVTESCQPDDPKWQDHGRRTRWQRGNGDGTFQDARPLPVPPRPTIAIAVGDLNRDGRLDLFFGNSYRAGDTYEGFPGDLLMSTSVGGGWVVSPSPSTMNSDTQHRTPSLAFQYTTLPEEKVPFDNETDLGGRPTYGAMILSLDGKRSMIYSLSYGRRWNRLWVPTTVGRVAAGLQPAPSTLQWTDRAPQYRLDGDFVRHGVYPAWLIEVARTRPQFPTKPEKPFRANGNSFDASIGDVDNDGLFDLLTTEITHAWAGESSDRSRVLFQSINLQFYARRGYEFSRADDTSRWNQGDLFGELADMDLDGNLDLVLSSGDYPDQWLRIFLQRNEKFVEAKEAFPVKHDGSQQISLGDVDGDGAPDLVVGQTFNRLNAEQIAGRKPKMRLFVNRMAAGHHHLSLRLTGDGKKVNRNTLGAIVKIELPDGRKMQRQLVGIGGHAGKQHDFTIYFGLGKERKVKRLEIIWPNRNRDRRVHRTVASGSYSLSFHDPLPKRLVDKNASRDLY